MPRRYLLLPLLLLLIGAILLAADWWIALPEDATAEYVGRKDCARCHEKESKSWSDSDHDRAMDLATPKTVLGDFGDRKFTHQGTGPKPFRGVTSTMSRRGNKFHVLTDGPTGKMETYGIKYVFGVRPLQQYLVEFPNGRVQCLPTAWDTEGKRWFHLYPDEDIPFDDVLHWTRPLQNWNYMCAECHSTNLQKSYNLKTDSYHTTFSEIDVSCEACHGPGSLHVKLADSRSVFWDRRHGYGLPRLKDDAKVEIETCAPCHSRRRVVYPGFQAGEKFLDYYLPELLDRDLYYADGQVLDEDYVYGSFIQSKMYRKEVRCSDCHDPHTARVKYADPKGPLHQPIDNRLCTDCHMQSHPAGKYDTPAHHFHPDASKPGTRCVECHMPETPYMVVDPRRDHSMRIPRPDLTVWLDVPNACNKCHHDEAKGETPEWAEAQLRKWYGPRKGPQHFAYAIDAGRKNKPGGEEMLDALARRKDESAMVRASALLLLSQYAGGGGRSVVSRGLGDPDALVRLAAVRSMESLPADELHQRLTPLLNDPIRAVRIEAARILSYAPRHLLSTRDREAFDAALEEYMTGQRSLDDQPAAHLNMAVALTHLGKLDQAEQQYRTALRIDPRFVPARINLAMLCDRQRQRAQQRNRPEEAARKKAEAERQFREVTELEPRMGEAYYSLGLLLAEDEARLPEAAEQLAKAAELVPDNPRIHYNYGLALQKLDKPADAERSLLAAYKLAPTNPDYLVALAILYQQQKHWERAIRCAEQLVQLQRGDRSAQAFLRQIRQQAEEAKKQESGSSENPPATDNGPPATDN